VIIRVFRARIAPGHEEAVHRRMREVGLPSLRSHDAVLIAQVGRGMTREGEELVVVSLWRDHGAVEPRAGQPLELGSLEDVAGRLAGASVDLYEAVGDVTVAEILRSGG
jgi:hypothetical protein